MDVQSTNFSIHNYKLTINWNSTKLGKECKMLKLVEVACTSQFNRRKESSVNILYMYHDTLRVFLFSLCVVCPTYRYDLWEFFRNISAPYNEHIFPCIMSFVLQYKTVLNTNAKIDKSDFCYLKNSKSSIRSLTQNMCSLNGLRTEHLLSEGVSWKIKGKWPVQECDSYTYLNCLQLEVICKIPYSV